MDIQDLRAAKDDFFRRSHDSPLDHGQHHGFTGLRYYPQDRTYASALRPAGLTDPALRTNWGRRQEQALAIRATLIA